MERTSYHGDDSDVACTDLLDEGVDMLLRITEHDSLLRVQVIANIEEYF